MERRKPLIRGVRGRSGVPAACGLGHAGAVRRGGGPRPPRAGRGGGGGGGAAGGRCGGCARTAPCGRAGEPGVSTETTQGGGADPLGDKRRVNELLARSNAELAARTAEAERARAAADEANRAKSEFLAV